MGSGWASTQRNGGWTEPGAGRGRSADAHWTANDDWLDALGLGWGPSRGTSRTPFDRAARSGAFSEVDRATQQAGSEGLTGRDAETSGAGTEGESSPRVSSNGGGSGGSDDRWFFDGSARGQAAVVADPARAREGTEQKSDRRKAANSGSAGGWGSQRGRGRDNRGSRGGRRGADGVPAGPTSGRVCMVTHYAMPRFLSCIESGMTSAVRLALVINTLHVHTAILSAPATYCYHATQAALYPAQAAMYVALVVS